MLYILMVFALLIILIFLGFPIYFATALSSILTIIAMDIPISVVTIKIFGGIDSFTLMAIPFFILAGNIMMESGITERILAFADALVGRFRGGLGHVNIVSSMIFAGIQGSGVADASAIGSIIIPPMIKQGYDKDYAVAITASSAVIGPIIPPSIAMIMFAYYTELSVGKLFLGGLIPGVLFGLGLMLVHRVLYDIRKYDFERHRTSFRDILVTGFRSLGALIMPVIIVMGIVFGVFTPTESGIAANVYGIFYGFIISKNLKVRRIPNILIESANTTAVVMITLAMAGILSNVLIRLDFQNLVIDGIVKAIPNRYLVTIVIMSSLLVLGFFIDPPVLIVMFASVTHEVGQFLGFDPIHYGVLMVITMLIGAITPPVGSMLFVSCSIAGLPLEKSVRILIPFIIVLIVVAVAVLFVPALSIWINRLVFRY